MMSRILTCLMVTTVNLLSACSLTPELVKPMPELPETYRVDVATVENGADLGWRRMFNDLRLQRLIELALSNNRDLRMASLNVDAVRAQFRIQESSRLPSVSATSGATRQRIAADSNPAFPTASPVQNQFTVGVALSAFEIDLFGRLRSLSDAAFARYLATSEGQRAAQISLVGAVADAYLAERLATAQLMLTQNTLTDWQQSLDIAYQLRQAEQNSGVDIAQAEGQVATAQADREARKRELEQARNALELLVAASLPENMPEGRSLDQQPIMTRLPPGLPSELLARRPDILQAEQTLLAANAEIGAARAAFFPRLSLTASLGFASPEIGDLFQGSQRFWSFSPQIVQPLFQGGRLRAELRLAEIRKSAAVVQYEQAVQAAFREVRDGLVGSETYSRQIEAQMRVVVAAERRRQLSNLRYRAGQESRLELLDSQRQSYASRQTLLDLRRDEFRTAVALYKALGGGLVE